MYSFSTIALYVLAAECFRRICLTLIEAFIGPLSKMPGPWLCKFHKVPYMIAMLKGDAATEMPALFDKYGNTVRVGPAEVLVTGPKAVQQIFGQEDWPKGPQYAKLRENVKIANLFNETDKVAYKQRVSLAVWRS